MRPTRIPTWIGSPLLWFVIASGLRLAYIFADASRTALFSMPLLDEAEIVETARNLLTQSGFGPEPLFRAPGYSIFVAGCMLIFGENWSLGLRVVQALLGGFAVSCVCATANILSPGGRTRPLSAGLAGFLMAVHGPAIRLESTISLDGPMVAAFAFLVYAMAALSRILAMGRRFTRMVPCRSWWNPIEEEALKKLSLGAGVAAALMVLLRPTILPVTACLILGTLCVLYRQKRPWGLSAQVLTLMAIPTVLGLGACTIRNGLITGEWRTMPLQGGYNLREANRLSGPSGRYLTQRAMPPLPQQAELRVHPLLRAIVDRPSANPTREMALREFLDAGSRPGGPSLNPPSFGAMDAWQTAQFVADLRQHPIPHLRLYILKLFELGSDREIFNYEDYSTQQERSPYLSLMAGRVGLTLPLAAFALGLALLLAPIWSQSRWLPWLTIVSLGTLLALSLALGYSSGRMRMPLMVVWAALAGCVPVLIGHILRTRSTLRLPASRIVWSPLIGAIAISAAWQDGTGVRSEATDYYDLGRMSNAAWHLGQRLEMLTPTQDRAIIDARYNEALVLARQATAAAPQGYPVPYRLEAQALSALNRPHTALAAWKKTALLLPQDASVLQNLATTLMVDLNRTEEAIPYYQKAVSLGSTESRAYLALAFLRLGRTAQARDALAPVAKILDTLAENPVPPNAPMPALPISARFVIAGAVLAHVEANSFRSDNLKSFLGPRGLGEFQREMPHLTNALQQRPQTGSAP